MLRKKDGSTVPGARPADLSGTGWRAVVMRVGTSVKENNLTLVSAGVAFYGLLAIFPALTALLSIYGLVADPAQVQQQIGAGGGMLPPSARQLLSSNAGGIAGPSSGVLGIGAIVGFLITLWSARKGAKAMVEALNIVYEVRETRSIFYRAGLTLLLTLAAIVVAIIALVSVVAIPAVLGYLGLGVKEELAVSAIRWPVLAVIIAASFAGLYRLAPNRRRPAWRWVGYGAATATVLWLIASALFSLYVSSFANYNKVYGAAGAIVVLLLWLFLSALIVLVGAEVNAAIEQQVVIEADEPDTSI